MASIDQLSIEINADADKATKAISNLTSHLNGLSLALNRINTNSIKKFASSMESLARTGRATDAATKSIENMAKSLSSEFGIKSKEGINAVTEGLFDLAEASKKFQQSDFSEKFQQGFKDAQSSVAGIIRDYAKIDKALDDDTKAVVDFVNKTRQGSVSIANFAKEFGDDFAQMKRVLGKGFTSELDATKKGVQDFEGYIESIKEATNTTMFENLAPEEAFRKLSDIMDMAKNSTMTYSEAVKNGSFAFEYANRVVDQYGVTIDRLVMQQDKLAKENSIDKLVESLKGLSEVSVPDFSSFAQAIDTLNRVNVDKVTRNLERVKQTLAEGTQKAQEMCTALVPFQSFSFDNFGNITNFIYGINDGFNQLSTSLSDATNSVSEMGQLLLTVNYSEDDLNESADNFNIKLIETKAHIDEIWRRMTSFNSAFPDMNALTLGTQQFVDAIEGADGHWRDIPTLIDSANDSVSNISTNMNDLVETMISLPDALQPFSDLPEQMEEASEGMKETASSSRDLSASLSAVASVLRKISDAFNKMATIAISALKKIASVIKTVVIGAFNVLKEYVKFIGKDFADKTEDIRRLFSNMGEALTNEMNRISAFWQRTLRTFTFMLVRKAITAVIKDIKSAVDELVLFEKHLGNLSGGAFNDSISQIIADFHLIGRAIVAAFEPLINWVVPILNAVADAIANVLATLGEFFAAFTGQNYFVKAKKTVVDYGSTLEDEEDAADDANKKEEQENNTLDDKKKKIKEIKKLLLGIDELNVLPKQPDEDEDDDKTKTKKPKEQKVKKQKTPKGSGINYKDAFEEKAVSDAMKGLVDKIKKILSDLFEPMKNAWDKVYPYLKKSWEYMGKELLALAKSIGKAFLEAWKSPITEHIFENIFKSVGDLMNVVGNLAHNFREAWDAIGESGKTKGVEIFTKVLEIVEILSNHLQDLTSYMKEWSSKINFNPLIDGINKVLDALKPIANFIGGVFKDVMENIVLEHIRYLIEEGIPHLCDAISEVSNAFDWEKLRSQLQPVEKAFESMRQQIHEGLVNAMKNLGVELGKWTQTENFQKFLDAIVKFMGQITAERVEKLFTGIGMGILKIVEGLADFVGSPEFDEWSQAFFDWYDSLSSEDITKFFYGIAEGIGKLALGIGKFIFSDQFKAFIKQITDWYKDLSADDISNFFGAIADAITNLGKEVGDFVSSEGFQDFLKNLKKYYDEFKSGDLADKLEKIAKVIAGFSFAAFATGGVAKFLDFLAKLGSFAKMADIPGFLAKIAGAEGIGGIGAAGGEAAGGLGGFVSALGSIALPVGIVIAAITSLISSYGGLQGVLDKIKSVFNEVADYAKKMASALHIDESINNLKKAFGNLYDSLGKLKPLWDLLFLAIQAIATFIVGSLMPAFQGFLDLLSGAIDVVSGVIDGIVGVCEIFVGAVVGIFTGNNDLLQQGCEDFFGGILSALTGVIELAKGALEFFGAPIIGLITTFIPDTVSAIQQWIQDIIDGFKNLKYELIGDPIVIDMVNGILDWFNTLFTDGVQFISDLVAGVIDFFGQLATDAVDKVIEFKDGVVTKFTEAKDEAINKATELKENAVKKFEEFKENAKEKFDTFKQNAETTFNNAKTTIVEAADKIKKDSVEKFDKFKEEAVKKFENFKTEAPKKIEEAKKKVVDYAKDMKEKFVEKTKDIADKAKEKFEKVKEYANDKFKAVKDKIKERMDDSIEVCEKKLEKIKGKFEKFKLENVGKNIISGFLSGLKQRWADVVSWASTALANFKTKFQQILQIHSPSKVFMKYGEYTVEGFNKGLEEFSDTTGKTVDKWVDSFSGMNVTLEPSFNSKLSNVPLLSDQKLSMENTGLTKQDLADVLREFGNTIRTSRTNGETKVILELDGRQIYEQVVKQDRQQLLRTGRSSFAY